MGEREHHYTSEAFLDEEFWDERYRESGRIWSGKPNPQLVAEVTGLVSGRALDVGCGEGADRDLARPAWLGCGGDRYFRCGPRSGNPARARH